MKLLFYTVLFLGSLALPMVTKADPKVGDHPPLLKATGLLQAPAGASLDGETLKGKVVILEFWATWCGPCVLAIPHLNELAEKFKDKPVQFIAITSEDETTVKNFLTKKTVNAWVALDAGQAMHTGFAVGSIPHTVVLGKDGLIAASTYPTTVTEQFIDDLLAGKKPVNNTNVSKSSGGSMVAAGEKQQATSLFEVSVRPSTFYRRMGSSSGAGSLQYRGYTVLDLLPEAFEGANSARVWTNVPLPEGRFDIVVRQPRGHSLREAHDLLWQAMQSAFNLTVRKKTNEMNVFILRKGQTNGPGLTPASTRGGATHTSMGKIEAVNAPLDWLTWVLEDKLGKPVIDETGLTNRYDLLLKWDDNMDSTPANESEAVTQNPAKLVQAVQEQLGLELIPSTRSVVGFEVGKLEKPKPSSNQK